MELACRAFDDPERINELTHQVDAQLEMLALATDAGYSTLDVIEALSRLCAHNQLLSEDPDPADDAKFGETE